MVKNLMITILMIIITMTMNIMMFKNNAIDAVKAYANDKDADVN